MARLRDIPLAGKLVRLDWLFLAIVLALCCFSVASIYSATYTSENPDFRNAHIAQLIWLCLGIVAFFVIALIDYNLLVKYAVPIFFIALVLLVLVLIPGVGTIRNGARSWIKMPGFTIQPAEFSKLAFIIIMALIMTRFQQASRTFKMFFAICGLTLIPVLLILKQPDFGSAAVFFPIAFAMMLVAGFRLRYLLIPVVLVGMVVAYTYFGVHKNNLPIPGLKPYQISRIKTFYNPNLDPQGAGWTINQSLIAIGSGSWQGKGWLQGTQINLQYLPRDIAYNDFIYAAICEEWGFIGGSLLILMQGFILLSCLRVALFARDSAGTFIATGVAALLFTHIFVNIGMTIKVVPITGIPLPFISYGGTFLVVCLAAMGLVQSVWIHRRILTGSDLTTRV
jgi:rod shape determining protein RodA